MAEGAPAAPTVAVSEALTLALLAFAATFVSVFALGLQSLNVNQGLYIAAGVTSFFISTGHLYLYKVMPATPSFVSPEVLGYYVGGIAGITLSIWFHRRAKAAILAWWRSEGTFWPPLPPRYRPPVDEHASSIYPECEVCGTAAGRCCPRLVCERHPESRN